MKKKTFPILVSALALCLTLTACNQNKTDSDDIPDSFDGMVKDSLLMPEESVYGGVWTGSDGSALVVELSEDGDELGYAIYDSDELIVADGYIQSVPDYGSDYFYNAHDGMAYRCDTDENGNLHIDTLGTFAKASGDMPGENVGDTEYESLEGEWHLDSDDRDVVIEIDRDGSWSLLELMEGDSERTAMDWGKIKVSEDGENRLCAVSDLDDSAYDITIAEESVLYWGSENDCYRKAA